MFKNKVSEVLTKYLEKYFFGFDPNQLNVSILKGKKFGDLNILQWSLIPN